MKNQLPMCYWRMEVQMEEQGPDCFGQPRLMGCINGDAVLFAGYNAAPGVTALTGFLEW